MRRPALFLTSCALATVFAGLVGCSAPRDDLMPGGDGDPGSGLLAPPDCTQDGQLRCEGNIHQTCLSGRWRVQRTCLSSQVCDQSLGCVQCTPALATACQGDEVHHCKADGTFGDLVKQCDPGMCRGGSCSNSCGENADLIYLVDEQYRLLSFNPRDDLNELKVIGNLSCPAGPSFDGGTATPFSMSVDRQARAWVLYNSGEIFWVSTKDASCKPSGFKVAQKGFETFGMGFVSDSVGSDSETLFITGGAHNTPGMGNLGSIDPMTLQVTSIGPLPVTEYGPELTGNGKAELWGYFPGVNNTFAAQLDKTSGMPLNHWFMPPLTGSVVAWAFAHWGGRFYLFVTVQDSMSGMNNSQVFLFTPTDGHVTNILSFLPYTIVGAGVSTCAPVIIG
jgi:hypothetical protein